MKNGIIVKNYKDENKPHLVAVVNYKDDKNQRKRKFFTTFKDAQEFANNLNFKAEKYGNLAKNIDETDTQDLILVKRDLKPYNISFKDVVRNYIDLTDSLKAYNADIEKAVKHFIEWNNKKDESTTLENAINVYMDSLQTTGQGKHHIRTQEPRLNRFMNDFKASCIVAMIQANQIEKWLNDLKIIAYHKTKDDLHIRLETKEQASPTTKNNYRRTLSAFFSFCCRKDYIKENPIKKVATLKEKVEEPKIYTIDEISKMLYCSKELSQERLYIALGAFAGLRVSELQKLTWDKIHFAEKEIVLDASITKTSQRRIVEISDNLLEWLKPYIEKNFKNVQLFQSEGSLRKSLEKFRDNNNIAWVDNGLRHSSASYHLAFSQNANLTAERMGHSVSMLKKHYMGLVRKADAIKYWNIYPKFSNNIENHQIQ